MRTAGLCAWEFRIYFRIEGAGYQGVLGLEGHQPKSWSPNQRPMFDFTMFLGTLHSKVWCSMRENSKLENYPPVCVLGSTPLTYHSVICS